MLWCFVEIYMKLEDIIEIKPPHTRTHIYIHTFFIALHVTRIETHVLIIYIFNEI